MATPQPDRPRRLDPASRRVQILEAAAVVFRRRDPASVKLGEVADAAGVSRSLVYAYFGDRGGLMAAMYLHSLRGLDAELSGLVRDLPVDEGRFYALIDSYLRLVDQNADMWQFFAATGTLEHSAVQVARGARMQRIADAWGGSGEARLLARGLTGLLEAAAVEWLETRPCTLDQAAELITKALWHGLARLPRPWPPSAV